MQSFTRSTIIEASILSYVFSFNLHTNPVSISIPSPIQEANISFVSVSKAFLNAMAICKHGKSSSVAC